MIKKLLTNKELFWTFLYQLITLVGGLVLIKLLATTLSKETYGYYSLINSIVALIVMLPFSALMQGVTRYISIYQNKFKYNEFFTIVIMLHLFIILIYFIFSIIFKNVSNLSSDWNAIYYWVVFFSFSEIIKILFRTINNTNRERKNLVISTFLEFSLKVVLVYLIYINYKIDIKYLLVIFIFSNIFSTLVMMYKSKNFFTLKSLKFRESKMFILRIWLFASPLVIWAIFGWLRDMSSRWYLDYFLDKEQVALFTMMSSIAMIAPTALQGLIGGFFVPILYQKENKTRGYIRRFLYKMLPMILMLFLLSFIITYFFKNEIILLIADEKYLKISWMLPWMFLTFSVYVLSMMATYEIFSYKKTKLLLWSSVVPGIISISCGYFLIKYYGINGALYNYVITYLSYALLTLYVVSKYIKSNKLELVR